MSSTLVELRNSDSSAGEDGNVGSCSRSRDITSVFSRKVVERVAINGFVAEFLSEKEVTWWEWKR